MKLKAPCFNCRKLRDGVDDFVNSLHHLGDCDRFVSYVSVTESCTVWAKKYVWSDLYFNSVQHMFAAFKYTDALLGKGQGCFCYTSQCILPSVNCICIFLILNSYFYYGYILSKDLPVLHKTCKATVFVHVISLYILLIEAETNGRHFADDVFKCIFRNDNAWSPIKISLKFVPKGPINNIPALVQIIAWRRSGDKPLSEPMMVSLTTHICITCQLLISRE